MRLRASISRRRSSCAAATARACSAASCGHVPQTAKSPNRGPKSHHFRRLFPVISSGCGNPIRSSTSVPDQPGDRCAAWHHRAPTTTTGTGFRVCAVCGAARFRVNHRFAIAMIGGDNHRAACGLERFKTRPNPASTASQAAMAASRSPVWPNHVRVGVVDHDQIIAILNRVDEMVCHLNGGHLGLHIIGRDIEATSACICLRQPRALPLPPFRKKVTCGYFSVSAKRN